MLASICKLNFTRKIFYVGFSSFFCIGITSCGFYLDKPPLVSSQSDAVKPLESVAALGQLFPLGEIRQLAAPLSGFGGTPRVLKLLIKEGDSVHKGQILAVFDNKPHVLADLEALRARMKTLKKKIYMQEREISRYRQASLEGAVSKVLLEEKEDDLIGYEGQMNEILAEIKGLEVELTDTELLSPIDGLILRLYARVGERPGPEGVLEVGASQSMQALVEVYESDVSRVKLGQTVSLVSENGGFKGTLRGKVDSISPQVRQRKVLSTDPTGDADARVVEVKIKLLPKYLESVSRLSGIKVIARFEP
tara:strand:+ start:1984 stop:2904 length:921 start_codon:yes stop_codon:yes gene_type:complete